MVLMFDWPRWQRFFPSVDLAQRWYKSVPDPTVAADWYFVGVREPAEAAEWVRLKKPPQVVRTWHAKGFSSVTDILSWVKLGQSIEQARRWIEIGYETPGSAGEWVSLGQNPESLHHWFQLGVESREELANLCAEGLTPQFVIGLDIKMAPREGWKPWTQLTTQGQAASPTIVNSWLVAHAPLSEAAEWVDVGATPFERDLLVSNGVVLQSLKKLKTSRCTELARNIRSHHQDLDSWVAHGFEFDEMMQWKQLGISINEVLDWQAIEVASKTAQSLASMGFTPMDYLEFLELPLTQQPNLAHWTHAALPQRSVKVFVLGGIPDPETAQKWLEGFGRDPSRAVAQYRAHGGDYRRARAAQRQAEKVRSAPPTSAALLHPQQAIRLEPSTVRLPNVSEEWLDEVFAWAHTLQSHLRKSIQSPSVLSLDDLDMEIQIELINDEIWGKVKVDDQTFTCVFNPESFDPKSNPDSSEQRFVLGVCLSWFIDCSIVIRSQRTGASALYRVANIGSGRVSAGIRYVPTPTFSTRRAGRSEHDTLGLKIRHQVSGHVRALPFGHHGSVEALSSAPRHIRKIMKKNDTYVKPHFRGTEEQMRELETRLSRYSALGEAMSDLDWF